MAENVQRVLEAMLPELTDLKNRKLFTDKEVKSIVKRRSAFEYAMIRANPVLMDFIRAIKYEINLDKLRRRRKLRMNQMRLSATISDFAIVKRIHVLFARALHRFSNDLNLWIQYIEWAIAAGSTRMLGRLFVRALHTHPLVPWLWVRAATYEFDVQGNADAARIIFQRGLRINPTSQLLWHEFFKMEMRFIGRNIARKAALGLIPTCEILQLTRAREAGEDIQDYGEIARLIPESVQALSDRVDMATQKVLSGILPITIFKNAILHPKLKDNLQFRLGFLTHIDAWLSSEESEFTKNLFKNRSLRSAAIVVTKHANDITSTRPSTQLQNLVDLECLEAAGVRLSDISDTILSTIARDFGHSLEGYLVRARAMLSNDDYIDPAIIHLVGRLEKAVVGSRDDGKRKKTSKRLSQIKNETALLSQRILPLTLAFIKTSTGMRDESDEEVINLLMKSSEVRGFALLEYMIRSSPAGSRAKAFYVFAAYLYERAEHFNHNAAAAAKDLITASGTEESIKTRHFPSADARNAAMKHLQNSIAITSRRQFSATKLAQCYTASFFRLANLSLNRIPATSQSQTTFSLALGRLWLKLILAQQPNLSEELLVKCDTHPLGQLIKQFAASGRGSSNRVAQDLDLDLEYELDEEIPSDSESDDSDSDGSDSDSSDSDSSDSDEDNGATRNPTNRSKMDPIVSLLDILLCCIKRSLVLRRRIDEGDLSATLAKEFVSESDASKITADDHLELESLTPFWLDVIEMFHNAYHAALLDEVVDLYVPTTTTKGDSQPAQSLAPLAWKRLHQLHEAALQAVPIQDAGVIFDSLLALNDFTAAFGGTGDKTDDFIARIMSTERIYNRALSYFREVSSSSDSMTVTKSIILNDITAPVEVQHARLSAGLTQAQASRESLATIKARYLAWALSVGSSCTTALSTTSGSERVNAAAQLVQRVVEHCVLADEATTRPSLETIVTCFQAELQAYRLSMLEIAKRRATATRLKAATSHQLAVLHQEETDLAQETTKRIRTLFERGVVYYGSTNPALWIEFIRCFVPNTGRSSTLAMDGMSEEQTNQLMGLDVRSEASATRLADLDEISRTYARAVRTLLPDLRQVFVTKYEALMERHE